MATSPSMSASVTQNCKVHDGSITQNGIISWSVAGQANTDFSPSKANYFDDTSGWSNRYYWTGASGTKYFSSTGSVTINTSITVYTKTIVASDSYYYSWYATEKEASDYCNSVAGSAEYYLTYSAGPNNSGTQGYKVYRRDLSISTSSSTQTVSTTITITSNNFNYTYTQASVNGVAFSYKMADLGSTYDGVRIGEEEWMDCYLYLTNPNGYDFDPKYEVSNSNSSVMSCSYSLVKTSTTTYNVRLSIKGLSSGSTTITVTSNGYSDSLNFIVSPPSSVSSWDIGSYSIYAYITNLKVPYETVTMTVGSQTVTETAKNSSTMWISVGSLNSNTTYSVKISTNQCGTLFDGTKTTNPPSPSVSSISLDKESPVNLFIDQELDIKYTLQFSNDNGTFNPGITVSTKDASILTYSNLTSSDRKNGTFKIKAISEGSTKITVTSDGKTKTIDVNVTGKYSYIGAPQYTALDYIESTGTQYIDTGIIGKSGIEIYIDFEYTSIGSDSQIPIGSMKSSSNRIYPISSGNYIGYGNYVSVSSNMIANFPYEVYTKLYPGEQILSINSNNIYNGTNENSYNSTYNMYLFACNKANSIAYACKTRIKYCKILENGEVVREFIPCKNALNEIGMYDKVSSTFFKNLGSGDFISGNKTGQFGSSVARKIKKIYLGNENNKAIKIKKIYIGDENNKAKLCFISS